MEEAVGASRRYTSGVESVASALTGTGGQLLSTVTIVTSTDDANTDLFAPPRMPWGDELPCYGSGS